MRPIKKVIIHCTDSDDSLDIGAREIREWHVNGNGWSDIGYHWVVRRSGRVEAGRDEAKTGAHVYGENSDSIGIVWVGRKKPAPKQLDGLMRLVRRVLTAHNLMVTDVYGHYEFSDNKTCPNIDMNWFRAELLFYGNKE